MAYVYKKRKVSAGQAFGAFGASFGMGLAREWQRAKAKDKEGGFMAWLKGEKAGKKEEAKPEAPTLDKLESPAVPAVESPPEIAKDASIQETVTPLGDAATALPVAMPEAIEAKPLDDANQYAWPEEPKQQPEMTQQIGDASDYQANW